ncbi:hypothetical protein Nepgr_029084 [Nepenthes gracilis]|uniref:DSBA-like thioredoxin domain-containing protein n=1 Tax=Nepenthes gracilis TaxID=150966 RepID=A0AAD3Y575_NEPGR|nr:hypothetical protein Nepgr_029084 [Nepenthes gracilis]
MQSCDFSIFGLNPHPQPFNIDLGHSGTTCPGTHPRPYLQTNKSSASSDITSIQLTPLSLPPPPIAQFRSGDILGHRRFMAQGSVTGAGKRLIQIDISSDTICPWCFVGKKHLDRAIAASEDQFEFQIKWHPFLLNPSAPKEGVNKREHYKQKFGDRREQIISRMTEVFKGLGLQYNMDGKIGNTLDSHRLIYLAGQQGLNKQHDLVEELFLGYFIQGKYIGDWEFLVESAKKVGVEGAAEFLHDPNNGLKEVNEDLEKYSAAITGVPHYLINGKQKLSGAQPPEVFLQAFQLAGNSP